MADVQETVKRRAEKKEKLIELGDFGFTYPYEAIRDFYWAWVNSGYTLTYNGRGWADEPPGWWDDVDTYAAIFTATRQQVEGVIVNGERLVEIDI